MGKKVSGSIDVQEIRDFIDRDSPIFVVIEVDFG